MRLWSIHPQYLDAQGLVALWRETLLAQKILRDETKGYRAHPQLRRFREHPRPLAAIATYLWFVYREGSARGYKFQSVKIGRSRTKIQIPVTTGQIEFEWNWLKQKLLRRDSEAYHRLCKVEALSSHPLFMMIEGKAEAWERKSAS